MTRGEWLPPWIFREHGHLRFESWTEQLDDCETPAVFVHLPTIQRNARAWTEAAQRAWPGGKTLYSLKACYLPDVLAAVRKVGCGAEVCTAEEAALAQAAGWAGEDVVWHAEGLNREDIAAIERVRPAAVTVDNADDLSRLGVLSDPPQVLVRVQPDFGAAKNVITPRGHKLGLPVDMLRTFVRDSRRRCPGVTLAGAAFHGLIRQSNGRAHAKAAASVRNAWHAATGEAPQLLDIGGGMESHSKLQGGASRYVAPLAKAVPEGKVLIEPGRSIVSDGVAFLATARVVKRQEGKNWVLIDATSNILLPLANADYRFAPVRRRSGTTQTYQMGDASSFAPGVYRNPMRCPRLIAGDKVVVMNAGAYTTSLWEAFMRRRPRLLVLGAHGPVRDAAAHNLVDFVHLTSWTD